MQKKTGIGRGITKTFLVLGTAGIIGYSVIKGKLLGRPPSKIRKGLLYAGLAGLILYNCHGDELKEMADTASVKINRMYSDIYTQKKKNIETEKYLDLLNDSLYKKELEIEEMNIKLKENEDIINENKEVINENEKIIKSNEKIIEFKDNKYADQNYILNQTLRNYMQKDSLLNLILKREEEQRNARQIKEKDVMIIQKKNPVLVDELLHAENYLAGKELEIKSRNGILVFYECESNAQKDIIWTFAEENSSLDNIALKFYRNKSVAQELSDYNRCGYYTYSNLPEGMPIALIEEGLKTKADVYKGGFPRYLNVSDNVELENLVRKLYVDEMDSIDVFDAIEEFNNIYGLDFRKNEKRASEKGNSYCILVPRFLEANAYSCYSEIWVGKNARTGR